MNKHHFPAVVLALGTGLASAQWVGPFEGGEAANAYRVPRSAAANVIDRATVAAQGREAARQVDSRAGYQSDAERTYSAAPRSSMLTRSQVRTEAITDQRDPSTHHPNEGGEAAP